MDKLKLTDFEIYHKNIAFYKGKKYIFAYHFNIFLKKFIESHFKK